MKHLNVIPHIRTAVYYTYANIGLIAKVSVAWLAIYAAFTLFFQLLGIAEYLYLTDAVAFVKEFPREARAQGYESLSILTAKLEAITIELGYLIQVHDILDKVLRLVIYASVGVAVGRAYLEDPELPWINFAAAELKFALYLLLFMAVVGGIGFVLSFVFLGPETGTTVTGIYYAIISLFLLFLVGRFLPIFPAIAVENNSVNLGTVWQGSTGNSWKIFGGMILVIFSSLPVSIFKMTIGQVALPISVIWPLQLFLSMIVLTFIMTFLSICYQYLVLGREDKIQGPLY